eukprot:3704936-Rhodomonas_salina.2
MSVLDFRRVGRYSESRQYRTSHNENVGRYDHLCQYRTSNSDCLRRYSDLICQYRASHSRCVGQYPAAPNAAPTKALTAW